MQFLRSRLISFPQLLAYRVLSEQHTFMPQSGLPASPTLSPNIRDLKPWRRSEASHFPFSFNLSGSMNLEWNRPRSPVLNILKIMYLDGLIFQPKGRSPDNAHPNTKAHIQIRIERDSR